MRHVHPYLSALALLFLALATSLAGAAESFTGKCVGVTDGDTITVMRDGAGVKVRLHGIDTPETGQPYGKHAKQHASLRCHYKEVTVQVMDVDRYGRLVGEVTLPDGSSLNEDLVANGLAWWYREYARDDVRLSSAEAQARSERAGLWLDPGPIAPWEWRRGVREPSAAPAAVEDADARSRRAMEQAGAARDRNAAERASIPLEAAEPPAFESSAPAGGPAPAATAGQTVFKTQSGKKYHSAGCRHLLSSRTPLTLPMALGMGLTPCSVCGPPSADGVSPAPRAPARAAQAPSYTAATSPPGAMQVEADPQFEQPSVPVGVVVYGTTSGKKYHAQGCRYLAKSQIPMGLADARGAGLEPCSVCGPAQAQPQTAASAEEMGFYDQAPDEQYLAPQEGFGVGSETVYLTNTGKKYHRGNCQYLARSKIQSTKAQAQGRGLGPCSVCQP